LDKDKDKEDSEYEEGDEDCDDEEKEEERREGEEKYNEEGEENDNGAEDVTNLEEKTPVQRVVVKEGKYSFIPWIKTNPSPQLAHDQSGTLLLVCILLCFKTTHLMYPVVRNVVKVLHGLLLPKMSARIGILIPIIPWTASQLTT
jgi:hypothetical protein